MTTKIKKSYSLKIQTNRKALLNGIKAGIPIGLGYFAVAFSLGIAAKKAGLTAINGFITSLLCNASAGQYIGFTLMASNAVYIEMAIAIFVANARYLLMSCALSQRTEPNLPLGHRMGLAFCITDEIFSTTVSQTGFINPNYTYGTMLVASPGWATGTALGIIAGELLPIRLVSAFSVALYGMFLATLMPKARENRVIAGIIVLCFVLSYTASVLPLISSLSDGTRTIILTVIISSIASIVFPHNEYEEEAK